MLSRLPTNALMLEAFRCAVHGSIQLSQSAGYGVGDARAAAHAGSDARVFQGALEKYFNGLPDPRTLELLER